MDTNSKIALLKRTVLNDIETKINVLLSLCESPIEKYFFLNAYAYYSQGMDVFDSLVFITEIADDRNIQLGNYHMIEKQGNNPLILKGFSVKGGNFCYDFLPQYSISIKEEIYRLDFAIFFEFTFIDDPNKGQTVKNKFAIECDGFDYHSTKEQLSKDYKRTRFLQETGWTVLRYTGQEIVKMKHTEFLNFLHTLEVISFKDYTP